MDVTQTLDHVSRSSNCVKEKGHSHSTDSKYSHESNLLLLWKLQMRKDRHWDNKECGVCNDIHGGVEEPEGLKVEAVALDSRVPKLGHWHASKIATDNGP